MKQFQDNRRWIGLSLELLLVMYFSRSTAQDGPLASFCKQATPSVADKHEVARGFSIHLSQKDLAPA
jgi:hypothetical protein